MGKTIITNDMKKVQTATDKGVGSSELLSGGYRMGKGYMHYNQYINQVRQGKKAIVLGQEYVVLSLNLYQE
ncbi:MAG: hypothetical protein GY777_00265, partial [Candidatus Brocadiaceae bacterium]|nr:hypothetical protein [Candidatus Brocadiaceae bacterium]